MASFRNFQFLLLAAFSSAAVAGCACGQSPIRKFQPVQLEAGFHAEGAAFGDLDGDGHIDVVAGPFLWLGPAFVERIEIRPPAAFDPKGYSDSFFSFIHDMDGDGRPDVVEIGFPGRDAAWMRNPGRAGGHWERHVVFRGVDNESPHFTDLTGDGRPELICMHGGRFGFARADWSRPAEPWTFHGISEAGYGGAFTHGLGVGDVDGDGRMDILWRGGVWLQPSDPSGVEPWPHHPFPFASRGGAQMLVTDVDGDGLNDVITSLDAHGYGLAWYRQAPDERGLMFHGQRLMGDRPGDNPYGIAIGNLHALALCDMDGDGIPDIVLGNRALAHGGRDPADRDPSALAWIRIVRGPDGVEFVPHIIHKRSGVGTQVVAGDITGNGLPDVVVSNKTGTWIHLQREIPSNEEELAAEAPRIRSVPDPGVLPKSADGRVLNLDCESGDLSDWTAEGDAFRGQPVKWDTVHPRRPDMASRHQGEFWIGTFEIDRSDRATGSLTSEPFPVTHPWASFLIGGGAGAGVGAEILCDASGEVLHRERGRNREDMHRAAVDLRAHRGRTVRLRVFDRESGGWGHVNFDDFRFHDSEPDLSGTPDAPAPPQVRGFEAETAARRMMPPPGFRVDPIAAEPRLHQPIAFAIDERGRLWIVEAHTYPVRAPDGQGRDSIVVFSDADGDGLFETRTVFAEGLNLASGIEVGFGGVWIGAAPYLLFIPDGDGDLVPDGPPEVILDGFGYQDTHETLNSFIWGPDGWLYGCHGVFTHSRVGRPGTPRSERIPINAGVWRFHPVRREFEVFAHGTSNPWGVDFDDRGQAFITACVIPHIFHAIQGGRYHRQAGSHFNPFTFEDLKTIADHLHYVGPTPHSGNLVSGEAGGGHAHCGCTIYLGDQFPAAYRGRVLMGNIHGNRINSDLIRSRGSGYVASHGPDFLLANDRWFRGIAMRTGPLGDLFLIDWYDKQACHRTAPEAWDRTNGRLYRVSYGPPRTGAVDLGTLPSIDLAALAAHPNEWHVRTARRLLQERAPCPEAREALLQIALGSSPAPVRLRGLWALHVAGGLDELHVRRFLGDADEYVRAWAVQLVCERPASIPPHRDRLLELARGDPSPKVRLYLASALGRVDAHLALDIAAALAARSEDAHDANIPLLLWYGIEPFADSHPDRFLEIAGGARIPKVRRFGFRRLAAAAGPGLQLLVARLASAPESARIEILEEMLAGLAIRGEVAAPAGWDSLRDHLAASPDAAIRDRATELAARFGDAEAVPELQARVLDGGLGPAGRLDALAALLRHGEADLEDLLHRLLEDPLLRIHAIRVLAERGSAATPERIIAIFPGLAGDERNAALAALAARPGSALALLDAISQGRLPADMLDDASLRRQFERHGDPELNARIASLRPVFKTSGLKAKQAIEAMLLRFPPEAVAGADPARGRSLFVQTCMNCHRLFDAGRDVGPDLTGSNRRDLRYLIENLVDPSAEVAGEYRSTTVWMDDGRVLDGIVAAETPESLTLKTATDTQLILLKDVARDGDGSLLMQRSQSSMMPAGQLDSMTDAQIRDLLAYLGSEGQVPVRADARSAPWFHSGRDLHFWDAPPPAWSLDDGVLAARPGSNSPGEAVAGSHFLAGDFRLTLEIRTEGNDTRAGIGLRGGGRPGYPRPGLRVLAGPGRRGVLTDAAGRLTLARPAHSIPEREWNTVEIVASGSRILVAVNGRLCADVDDPSLPREGLISLHALPEPRGEARFRKLRLEVDPEPVLKTLDP